MKETQLTVEAEHLFAEGRHLLSRICASQGDVFKINAAILLLNFPVREVTNKPSQKKLVFFFFFTGISEKQQ